MKRIVGALVALSMSAGTALAAGSTINTGVPANSSPLLSAPVRNNFVAAANDINNTLSMFAGTTAPTSPVTFQQWANPGVNPAPIELYDGTQFVLVGLLDRVGHTYSPALSTASLQATAPISVGISAGIATVGINIDTNFAVTGGNLAFATASAGFMVANCTSGTAEPVACSWTNFANQAIGNTDGILPYRIGGTWTSIVASSATVASTIMIRDASANVSANNFLFSTNNITSAAGTTILTVASPRYQRVTGSTTQTIQLPNGLSLVSGTTYEVDNNSTGVVSVVNNGSGAVATVPPGGYTRMSITDTSTTNGVWDPHYLAPAGTSWGSAGLAMTQNGTSALSVGPNGATNPVFQIDASTASAVAGLKITGAVTGGTVAIAAIDSGSNTNLSVNAKGTGTIGIGNISTGAVMITPPLTLSAALTYGGVTLSNSVTGTASMVLGTSPTLTTPTINGATISGTFGGAATFSGNLTHSAQGIFTGTSAPASAVGNSVVMGTITAPSLANNGQAFLYNTTVNGAVLQGQGSTYDSVVANKSGAVAIGVSTGTTNVVFGGTITAASLSISGTIGGSLCATSSGSFVYQSGLNCFTAGTATSVDMAGSTSVTNGTDTQCLYDNNSKVGNRPCEIVPQRYGASGSILNTTGTISASSTSLSLASAIDFANGQGIRINHAGATFTIPQPTSLTVTPTGTTGSTSYQYTIASIDAAGGIGATVTPVSISNGNATLSTTNYNALSWSAAAGATGYVIFGNKSGTLNAYAIVTGTTWRDTGQSNTLPAIPDWVPNAGPIASALPDWLITTINSGGGTATLTLAVSATNAVTSGFVIHSDTAAIQAAESAAESIGGTLYIPRGIYPIETSISIGNHILVKGDGIPGDNGAIFANSLITSCSGMKGTVICSYGIGNAIVATTNAGVQLMDFALVYPHIPLTASSGVQINGTGVTNTANDGSIVQRLQVYGAYYAIDLENAVGAQVLNNEIYQFWGGGILMNSPLWPSYNQNRVIGNRVSGDQNANSFNNVCQFGFIEKSGGDFIISGNKFNGCVFGNGIYLAGAASGTQTMEPIVISGNSVEGFNRGIYINWSNNTALASDVVITGNQLWDNVPIWISSGGSTSGASIVCGSVSCVVAALTITGNVLQSQGGASSLGMLIDGVIGGNITGNYSHCFSSCGAGSTAISLTANSSYVTVGVNGYDPNYTHVTNSGSNNRINATD